MLCEWHGLGHFQAKGVTRREGTQSSEDLHTRHALNELIEEVTAVVRTR